jgi:hypothetical protein
VAASLVDTAPAAAHIVEDTDTAAHPLDTQGVDILADRARMVAVVVVGILVDMAHMVAVVVGSTVAGAAVDLPLMMQAQRCLYPLKLL